MILISFLLLFIAHYIAGFGVLYTLRINLGITKQVTLSLIIGVAMVSLVPFVLELSHIPLTLLSVSIGILMLCAVVNIRTLRNIRTISFAQVAGLKPSFKIYEWPFMILFGIMMLSSVWKAYYFPPSARDALSGPEAIAEFAVREHTMINSVFSVNLETTNNHQKSPYIAGLQIIYKLSGFAFGQLWLSVLAISFSIFLFQLIREKIHAFLACILMMLFLAIPEIYAYSYVILFDYSNMVFFFLGFYFLGRYFQSGTVNEYWLSTLLFGFATYIRLETLILIGLLLPVICIHGFRSKIKFSTLAVRTAAMFLTSFLFYFIWMNVFIRYYMPGGFEVNKQLNSNLTDVSVIWQRIVDMCRQVLFGGFCFSLWGYYSYIFLVFLFSELIVLRKLSRESRYWLYGVLAIFVGLPFIGYLLPLFDIKNTTKRGLFKMMPLILMLIANNGLVQRLSQYITEWESSPPATLRPATIKQNKRSRNK